MNNNSNEYGRRTVDLHHSIPELVRLVKGNSIKIEEIKRYLENLEASPKDTNARKMKWEDAGGTSPNRINALINKIDALEERIANHIQESENQNQVKSLAQALDMLGNGLEELNRLIGHQAASLQQQSENIDQVRTKLREIVSSIAEDQQQMFERLTNLVEQYHDDFRSKLINSEYRLQKNIDILSNEFKVDSEKFRTQIAHSNALQDKLDETINEAKAIIDDRVQEKLDAISTLMASVTTKTEEIALLLKTSNTKTFPNNERSAES
ncbi:MAG: hypothetical protein ACFFFG_07345 [Candidatus Thorarchaeota archaeon]